ncbi:4a-hydroxytetrahydrobiopterin dehydratase [Fluviicoccus keumensis]|uniref:4a-hydroxytetrahydrobiopterin dehydratase n=1 Tax=Fluviicoccus keumensis TaxID=1435465 RepID=A0A4Q7ZA80_9GAMM|nr:4a-hydroxytetrahydrobiopterin dehydratase [Fluviicoccus keumensis]RZU47458.1 4a-hydroxytetrahydrobiopterin dehydratase [Fluviicoccus keumensis]
MEKSAELHLTLPELAPWSPSGLYQAALLEHQCLSLPHWRLDRSTGIDRLFRQWETPDFAAAARLAARLAELAEAVQHHPEITIGWGFIRVCWYTRDLGGVHENDLRLAHATEQLFTRHL